MKKRRVVGKIHGMKRSWKGHKDRNRHKNKIKRSWQALLLYVKDINCNIPTTWKWAREDVTAAARIYASWWTTPQLNAVVLVLCSSAKSATPLPSPHVSQCGLAVRRLAGKQKDLGSIRFGSSFSSLQKIMVYGHCLVTLPTQLMKYQNGSHKCPP